VRRRDFIKLLGGAAANWSPAASAEQSAMPVIGYLDSQSPGTYADTTLHGYRRGLKEAGYVEGENVTVEYRSRHVAVHATRGRAGPRHKSCIREGHA
jgi:putative ABC transport system substrate-binding protein